MLVSANVYYLRLEGATAQRFRPPRHVCGNVSSPPPRPRHSSPLILHSPFSCSLSRLQLLRCYRRRDGEPERHRSSANCSSHSLLSCDARDLKSSCSASGRPAGHRLVSIDDNSPYSTGTEEEAEEGQKKKSRRGRRISSLVFSSVGLTDQYNRVVTLPPAAVFLHADERRITVKDDGDDKGDMKEVVAGKRNGFCSAAALEEEAEESSVSSLIGAASSSSSSSEKDSGDKGEEEVQSKRKEEEALGSLNSLEESLPIKRGLSNFFSGKSKSFASLSDVANAAINDLKKPENPFNKRRRILMASKARSASYNSLISAAPTSLPPLLSPDHAVEEGDEEDDEKCGSSGSGVSASLAPALPIHGNNDKMASRAFSSPRSFSLSDLQHA